MQINMVGRTSLRSCGVARDGNHSAEASTATEARQMLGEGVSREGDGACSERA